MEATLSIIAYTVETEAMQICATFVTGEKDTMSWTGRFRSLSQQPPPEELRVPHKNRPGKKNFIVECEWGLFKKRWSKWGSYRTLKIAEDACKKLTGNHPHMKFRLRPPTD